MTKTKEKGIVNYKPNQITELVNKGLVSPNELVIWMRFRVTKHEHDHTLTRIHSDLALPIFTGKC